MSEKHEKVRLDVLLVERGLFPSRERAQGAVLAGLVFVFGQPATKPGSRYARDAQVEVRGNDLPFVSRGGLKLEKALDTFGIDVGGKVAVDVGASTGGFTDCLLKRGAPLVYAVDVGYGQLAWSLRQDPRVVVLERTNARFLDRAMLAKAYATSPAASAAAARSRESATPAAEAPVPRFASVDVSFISLDKILPALAGVLAIDGRAVCLVKPQFEAGRTEVGKKGVVRDPDVHRHVLERVAEAARVNGFAVAGLTFSPVTGPEGNIEYLAFLTRAGGAEGAPGGLSPLPPADLPAIIDRVVQEAHATLA
ncbi:MAG: TlyA family RNA methyltransferase [Bacillota bacterium]